MVERRSRSCVDPRLSATSRQWSSSTFLQAETFASARTLFDPISVRCALAECARLNLAPCCRSADDGRSGTGSDGRHNRGGVRHLGQEDAQHDPGARRPRPSTCAWPTRTCAISSRDLGSPGASSPIKTRRIATSTGAPVVELYGILEGSLEVWWKPYAERGTSAWSHRVLHAGDWLVVDSLQCHIVPWLTEGKGVVLKATSLGRGRGRKAWGLVERRRVRSARA